MGVVGRERAPLTSVTRSPAAGWSRTKTRWFVHVIWSPHGGVGSTTVACGAALCLAEHGRAVWLVGLADDCSHLFGVETGRLGWSDWLARPDAPVDALPRLTTPVHPRIGLLGPGGDGRDPLLGASVMVERLAAGLAALDAVVVVDAGTHPLGRGLLRHADRSTVVLRNDVAGLRATGDLAGSADDAVVVVEPGRVVGRAAALRRVGLPSHPITLDPSVARRLDLGLSNAPLPRRFRRELEAWR